MSSDLGGFGDWFCLIGSKWRVLGNGFISVYKGGLFWKKGRFSHVGSSGTGGIGLETTGLFGSPGHIFLPT